MFLMLTLGMFSYLFEQIVTHCQWFPYFPSFFLQRIYYSVILCVFSFLNICFIHSEGRNYICFTNTESSTCLHQFKFVFNFSKIKYKCIYQIASSQIPYYKYQYLLSKYLMGLLGIIEFQCIPKIHKYKLEIEYIVAYPRTGKSPLIYVCLSCPAIHLWWIKGEALISLIMSGNQAHDAFLDQSSVHWHLFSFCKLSPSKYLSSSSNS